MHVRTAQPADAGAIARVSVDTWRATYRGIMPDDVLDGLSYGTREQRACDRLAAATPGSVHLVAEDGSGHIVGFVDGGPERTGDYLYDAEIYALYVLPHMQGQGLGKRLLLAAAEHLHRHGFASLMLWVAAANAARGFYEACGGTFVANKHELIAGATVEEVAYGWEEITSIRKGLHARTCPGH